MADAETVWTADETAEAEGSQGRILAGPYRGGSDPRSAVRCALPATLPVFFEIMAALRTPGTGCPWDLEQNFATIAPYTIEEAYEVADAIARGDLADLREELGDLLLQVIFHARMAQEQGAFDFADVVETLSEKLIRRHPHVFGEARDLAPQAVKDLWERIKREERAQKANGRRASSGGALAGVPVALPAVTRALKLQAKAGKVGFDWNDPLAVLAKIREEADEIEAEIAAGDRAAAAGEVGDLLFAVVNLARHLDVDPEATLRATNRQIRTPLRRHRTGAGRARQDPAGGNPRGDGRPLERGEGCGTSREGAVAPLTAFTWRKDPKYLSLLPGLVITFTSYPVPTNGAQQ